jgi:hypothetical protein
MHSSMDIGIAHNLPSARLLGLPQDQRHTRPLTDRHTVADLYRTGREANVAL